MNNKTIIVLIAIVVFMVQAACSFGTTATQAPAPTQDVNAVVATNVALTQAAQPVLVLPTSTTGAQVALPTTAPLVLPTTAPVALVSGVVNYGANCRTGPGANFPVVVVLLEGAKVDIVGQAKATDGVPWWQVRSTGQPDCWLIDGALAISGDTGSVVVVVSPPTPTPVPPPSWTGVWKMWQWQGIFVGNETEEVTTITITQTGNYLSWNYYAVGIYYTGSGTVTDDGMLVIGTENSLYGSFGVRWERNPSNLNQFRGRWWFEGAESLDGAYCGSLNGAPKPSPCKPNN